MAAGFDYNMRPDLLTDFRFGWFRYKVFGQPNGIGTTPALDAGIPGVNVDKEFNSGMPAFFINGYGNNLFKFGYALGVNGCNCPLIQNEDQFQFVNNWSKVTGNHNFKFGADIRRARQSPRAERPSPLGRTQLRCRAHAGAQRRRNRTRLFSDGRCLAIRTLRL